MQRFIFLLLLMIFIVFPSLAQKDINAWKSEQNIEEQYSVFKKNLNFWDGKYFMNETQLDDYYKAFSDSVTQLESKIAAQKNSINELRNELQLTNTQLNNTNADLETAINNRNSIEIFGIMVEKGFYTAIVSVIILGLVLALLALYFLYKRSNSVTVKTKKDYNELKEEFETHKKESLERYTKINMELHHTRLEMNKK